MLVEAVSFFFRGLTILSIQNWARSWCLWEPPEWSLKKNEASTASGGDQSEAEGFSASKHSRQTSGKKKRLSLSPRYEFKSQSIKVTPCALSVEAKTLHKQLRKITSDPWVLEAVQAYHFDFTEIPL